ncbi:Ger(x)C family spore germination protein [Neobacillus niacini]|uniref:Ger(x)C family spore germination protein n=1 Tax=Neobacillus niacini TaxID=86668 RepID=UPI0039834008
MKKMVLLILVMIPLLLSGCWDQRLLVNRTLVNGISFDLTKEGKIASSVRALNIKSMGGGQFELNDELVKAERPTVVGLGLDLDSTIAGEIDASKAHVVIIGEELAKKGVQPLIEFFYRNRDSYIASKIVIGKGKAKEILSVEKEKSPIAFVILQLIEGAEKDTVIPRKNTFTVWNNILDPGIDMVLPYVKRIKSDKVEIAGVALFNGDTYTGETLPKEKSSILLLMTNQLDKLNRMAMILDPKGKRQSISFTVRNLTRDLEVQVDKNNQITCKIDLNLDIEVLSFPQEFKDPLNTKELNQNLSNELTKQAKEVTDTLLEANCDALGIGRRISSYHHELWGKINWDEEYRNVRFEPNVKVNIIKTGILF